MIYFDPDNPDTARWGASVGGSGFGVDPALMRQVAAYTGEQAVDIRADLVGLSRQVAELLSGGWSGAAASAFAAAWNEFESSAQDVAATLDRNAELLAGNSSGYGNGEAVSLQSIASVQPAVDMTFAGLERFA